MDIAKVQEYVLERLTELFPRANKLLLAVSGGSDSVALLCLLTNSKYTLSVVHFDHSLRQDSAEDAVFVKELCRKLNVPFYSTRVEVAKIAKEKGWNLEDAARRLRYDFFTHTAKDIAADAIVTAHTLDDQAETVLMQLLRGAAFLKGMKARQGALLRPLIGLSKEALLGYLKDLGQSYCTDKTNFDTSYTRAWLRHEILPRLEQRYPNIKLTLMRLAELQKAQSEHFDKLTTNKTKLEVKQLRKVDKAVQRHIVANLVELAGIPSDFEHIEMICESLNDKHPTQISLPKGKLARIRYGSLDIVNGQDRDIAKNLVGDFWIKVREDLNIQILQGLNYRLSENPDGTLRVFKGENFYGYLDNFGLQDIDFDRLANFTDLKLRYRQAGDSIKLVGGTKKLADLFIDRKIPHENRDNILLLASRSEVLWVEGVATDVRVAKTYEDNDVKWMKIALEEAKVAAQLGELPVGAAVVKESKLVAKAANITERENNPTAHAEIIALAKAAKLLQSWRLDECILYTTLEPCPMCFGAMLQAHLPELVYGASNHREGVLGSVTDLQEFNWKHKLKVRSGVLAKDSSKLLSNFFKELR